MPERTRRPPLLSTFGFAVHATCVDSHDLGPAASARALTGLALPPTSRTHPERRDLELISGPDAGSIVIRTLRPAKRPSNWVRKMNALYQALGRPLQHVSSVLMPGASPFSDATGPSGREELCLQRGLRLDIPFERPGEFGKLMAAVRVLLPLIPAYTASSPLSSGLLTGCHSSRLRACVDLYDRHPVRVGGFIPEALFEPSEYDREIIGAIATTMARSGSNAAFDTQHLDLRAATASQDPDMITIHALDAQENPAADLAVIEFTLAVLRALISGHWVSNYLQRAWNTEDLLSVMSATIKHGSDAVITSKDYLFMFGMMKQEEADATRLLRHLFVELYGELSENARKHMGLIIENGDLAARLMRHLGAHPSPSRIREVYTRLAASRNGEAFL